MSSCERGEAYQGSVKGPSLGDLYIHGRPWWTEDEVCSWAPSSAATSSAGGLDAVVVVSGAFSLAPDMVTGEVQAVEDGQPMFTVMEY